MKSIFQKLIGMALISILLASTNVALAATQADINSNQKKIDEAEEKQKQVESDKTEAMKQVESINSKIDDYETQISDLDSKITDANTKIKEEEKKLAQAEQDYKEQEELIKKRMVAVYTSGDTSYLDVLLSSKNLTDFISSYYLVSEVTKMDAELLDKIQKQKEEIETAKKEIENNKDTLTASKTEKENVNNQLKTAKTEKDKYVAQLSDQEKELEQEIQQLKQDNAKIANEIKQAEIAYKKQLEELKKQQEAANSQKNNNSNNSSNSNSGKNNNSGSFTTPTGSGYFMKPVSGGSISTNGYYSSGKFHGAIDYAISSGSPVYAAAAGVVMITDNLTSSYGTYVVIRHANGMQSYYGHGTRGSICVSPGQIVKKGQQIMLSGSTGNSSGPHLHFELRTAPYSYRYSATAYGQDSRVNPLNYM
jgi:septal ring factor EnvC (AmiA/AmiB activator)